LKVIVLYLQFNYMSSHQGVSERPTVEHNGMCWVSIGVGPEVHTAGSFHNKAHARGLLAFYCAHAL
jgi:hypothetical protein